MKLKELAATCGKSVPFIITTRKKFELPASKDYSDGYDAISGVIVSNDIFLPLLAR